MKERLQQLRGFYEGYNTRSYQFRKQQLQKLKAAILHHEEDLYEALYSDLKKSREESWVTEVGFLVAEINHTLKHLHRWMKPQKVRTNLMNLPSKSFVYKEPLGVVLIIGPWNYPLQLLFTPLVGAMAAGNCAVLKPSEFAPATSAVMKLIIEESFSKEYIFYAEGEGATIIPQMMNAFRFDHIFYTGSIPVGKLIYEMAAKQLVPVTLELGGKSPCVVESDAKLTVAAKRIALTKFSNAGQMCVAPDYILVHQAVKEKFSEELKRCVQQFFSEDPSGSYNYGKIINEKQFNRLVNYLQHGRIVYGGKHNAASLYIEPTIIEDIPIESTIMEEEIFGPVLPILTFHSFEEAKAIIERNSNPLAFYIFTESKEREKRWIEKISFGGGCVNNASWHLTNFNLPFGGRGKSGIGAYHGKYSFDAFSHQKAIMKTPTWFDPKIKYPPFKGKLNLFKKLIR
ncbi:MAG: aldehyde dehydrogenase [Flavisolibacter sp.]|nr:aldehyde dehydrogenase [Flavisolibacter sp.]